MISLITLAQTSITCDSIIQTSTCAGGNVIIPFQYTGSFPFGNVFKAEMSNAFGQFNNPVTLGTTMFAIGGNGVIFGTIPPNTNFGIFYRVRIVSTNPADTSSNSPNTIIVTQVAQLNQIVSNPGDSACPGDTITLTAINPASSYMWSTGDTTQSIQVTASGVYTVTTTDFLTCQSTTSDTVVFDISQCTGISENGSFSSVQIYPNPSHGTIMLSNDLNVNSRVTIAVFNAIGEEVFEEKTVLSPGMPVALQLHQPAGIYSVRLADAHSCKTFKLMIEE
ncbi:MAG: hypothetical protein Fur0041_19730 [Bacteroidia bacterium]